MDDLTLSLFDVGLESLPDLEAALREQASEARAFRTRSRIQARRAAGEERLAQILPADIADGDAWHVMSSGDVDSMSFVAHLMQRGGVMDYVAFSTWCMAVDDVMRLDRWIDTGQIARLDAYVGEIFPGSYAREHTALCATVRKCAGRVAVFRNHSKVFLLRSGQRAWVVESSANINTNPRTENTVITADMGLFEHHKAYFDQIKSFARDFDDWQPWGNA